MEQNRFTNKDIKALAKHEGQYTRALECVGKLFDFSLNCSPKPATGSGPYSNEEQEDFITDQGLTCKCHGTSGDIYKISITISQNAKGLKKATCSCPYQLKTEDAVCKHILAVLLRYCCKDNKTHRGIKTPNRGMMKAAGQKAETQAKSNKHQNISKEFIDPGNNSSKVKKSLEFLCGANSTPPQTPKQRSLPTWMKSNQKSSEKKEKTAKRSSVFSHLSSNQNRSPPKKKFSIKRTIYCMTPEEFLLTARQIIEEHENEMAEKEVAVTSDEREREKPAESQEDISVEADRSPEDSASHLDELMFGCTDTMKETLKFVSNFDQSNQRELGFDQSNQNELDNCIVADSLVPQTVTLIPDTLNLASLRRKPSIQNDPPMDETKSQRNVSILDEFF